MICEKHLYKEDLYRFYGKKKLNIKEKINMSQEMKYIVLFRKVQETRNPIKKLILKIRLRRKQNKTQIQISYRTKIGKGFFAFAFPTARAAFKEPILRATCA